MAGRAFRRIGTLVTLIATVSSARAELPRTFCNFHLGEETAETRFLLRLAKPTREQVAERMKELNWDYINETLFILPHNDGEAWRASAILEAIGAPHVRYSNQAWGAKLDLEEFTSRDLKGIKRVVTFEMPGVEKEAWFSRQKIQVEIIDHHTYAGLNRYRPDGSLDQLCEKIGWKQTTEDQWISMNDRAFVPGLKSLALSPVDIQAVRRFDYLSQGQLYGKLKTDSEVAAKRASELRPANGYYTIRNEDVALIREALAVQSTDGVVNVFESDIRFAKVGFSGDPRVVDALVAFDFKKLGYAEGDFSAYSVGSAPSKLFGFKAKAAPKGSSDWLPDSVIAAIEEVVKAVLAEKRIGSPR